MSRKHHRNPNSRATPNAAGSRSGPASRSGKGLVLYGVIAVAAAALVLAVYYSQPGSAAGEAQAATSSEQPAGQGALSSMAAFYNFGSVSMSAGNVRHRYTITNVGAGAVTITKLYTSCMCTTATLVTPSAKRGPFGMPGHGGSIPTIRERLAPGEMAQVEVVFDPNAHGPAGVGRIDRTVTIENDAGGPMQLAFTAMVRP